MSYRKKHIHPRIRGLKRKKQFFQRHLFWIIILLIVIIAGLSYFVLFFPKFQIAKIDIVGNENVTSDKIQHIVLSDVTKNIITTGFLNIDSKSIFTVSTKNIRSDILRTFPEIEEITIDKHLPDSILLKIKERKPYAVFCEQKPSKDSSESVGNTCFSLDGNGVIFKLLQRVPENTMVVYAPPTNKDIFNGENVIEKKMADTLIKVQNSLKNNFQIDVTEILVSNPLIFTTSEHWQIYFDPTSDIDLQIAKMNALLKNEILGDARKNLKYIYLQYKDKAFYR